MTVLLLDALSVENSTEVSSGVEFGLRHVVREHRKRLRLTQDELAERAGTTGETISRIERGVVEPSPETLRALAPVFGMPVRELLALLDHDDEGAVAPVWTPRQQAVIEEVAKATAPPGEYNLFLSHAMQGDPPEAMRRYFEELRDDGPEMSRLVGPRGMIVLWRLINILHTHRDHRDTIIPAIEAFLADLDARTP